ncbi:hypothetical protein BDD12DRAFT_707076, partial [Trichophaea hybrida]
IDEFFAQYPEYPYDHNAPFWQEFRDMCDFFDLERTDEEQKAAWKAFRIAVVRGFGMTFGSEENDIHAWGRLCETAGLSPIPEDLEGRRNAILNTHINLVDMHQYRRMGLKSKIYETEEELRNYTIQTGKFFPLEEAYAAPLLCYLLREI